MKVMKRLLIIALLLCGLYSCSKYDDGPLTKRVEGIEGRVSKLEQTCSKLNQDLTALQNIVTRLQNNDYVTAVTPLMEQGKQVGYTLTFAKSAPVQIRDGKNGKDGVDGKNGVNGKDGHTPVISIKADSDGIYYWTIDGNWLLNAEGQKVKAEGKDGVDGKPGADGKDGVDGKPGADGKDGVDGKPGATSPIKEVKVEETRILLTLSTDEVIAVPRTNPKALKIEAPDSMEIDFDYSNSVSINYTIVNGTAPTIVSVETTKGLKATLQESSNGLSGTVLLEVTPSTATKGLVVIKVLDARGKEFVKVVSLTQKPKDPSSIVSDDPTPIAFKDPTVKLLLLELCDSNGDGEISYAEASKVEKLPNAVFKDAQGIKSFDELQYFTSLKSIPSEAFQGCNQLTSVVIPKGVTWIGSYAFNRCRSLTSVVIPEGVTTIEHRTFNFCSSLTSVVIPKGVTWIGSSAFSGCTSLASVSIPEGVTTIGSYSFYNCGRLTSVVIPKGVTLIQSSAFESCSGLTKVKLPSTLKTADLKGVPTTAVITVPKGYAAIYRAKFFSDAYTIVEE